MEEAKKEKGKKKTYFAGAQKRYNEKCVQYAIKYTPNEKDMTDIISFAIDESGKSTNAWLKECVLFYLEKHGYL